MLANITVTCMICIQIEGYKFICVDSGLTLFPRVSQSEMYIFATDTHPTPTFLT